MFNKLREVLLTQYMGSILAALLCCQALIETISTAVYAGFWFFNHQRTTSVLGGSSDRLPWHDIFRVAVKATLYLLTAYGLARWLYPTPARTPEHVEEDLPPTEDQP